MYRQHDKNSQLRTIEIRAALLKETMTSIVFQLIVFSYNEMAPQKANFLSTGRQWASSEAFLNDVPHWYMWMWMFRVFYLDASV